MDKIICVGKNYLAHAKELGDAIPEKPVLFLKPPSVLKQAASWDDSLQIRFPDALEEEVHPECEIVIQIKQGGYKLTKEQAEQAIAAVTLGLDMTLRTRQAKLKKDGHPWTTAKVFPDAAILAPWIPVTDFPNYLDVDFALSINNHIKQCASGHEMTMLPVDLLVYMSQYFPLCPGDIIFTGTPVGVAAVSPDDLLKLQWANKTLSVEFFSC